MPFLERQDEEQLNDQNLNKQSRDVTCF